MTGTVRQTNLLQPMQASLLSVLSPYASHQQWHGDILKSGKFGQ